MIQIDMQVQSIMLHTYMYFNINKINVTTYGYLIYRRLTMETIFHWQVKSIALYEYSIAPHVG